MGEVAISSPLPGEALTRLGRAHTVRLRPAGPALEGRELAAFVGNADALVCLLTDRVDGAVFEACQRLKVVANYAVGVDNIDLAAAEKAGVWVTNTPDVLTEATADLAWALILAVSRRVVEGDHMVRAGAFHGVKPDLLLGTGLQGKQLGIVGLGRIGRAVARRAIGFGMHVAAFTRTPPPDGAPAGVEQVGEVEALLRRSSVLSLHCPLTPETRHLLDAPRLALLPHGALVVNTSRGEVIDEGALVEALARGHLGGAGLDVYEHEPSVHPGLLGRNDVVLLPHIGSATVETRATMADLAVDNVLAVLAGGHPPTPVVAPARPR